MAFTPQRRQLLVSAQQGAASCQRKASQLPQTHFIGRIFQGLLDGVVGKQRLTHVQELFGFGYRGLHQPRPGFADRDGCGMIRFLGHSSHDSSVFLNPMFTVDQLIAHGVGDYLLQSEWMAREKTKRSLAAAVHCMFYVLPFLFITQNPVTLFVIGGTHFVIDRWHLARQVAWLKNRPWPGSRPWSECRATGFDPDNGWSPLVTPGESKGQRRRAC